MELSYLRDLFQQKPFHDSMKISLWEESGEPSGLARSAEMWEKPVELCTAASQGDTRYYPMNLLTSRAQSSLPQTE